MCIHDGMGVYVLAKTPWLSPICSVDIGDTLGDVGGSP